MKQLDLKNPFVAISVLALFASTLACLIPSSNPNDYTFELYEVALSRAEDDSIKISGIMECSDGDCGGELCVSARWYEYEFAEDLQPGPDGSINRPQGVTDNAPVFTAQDCGHDLEGGIPKTFEFVTAPAPTESQRVIELNLSHPDDDGGPTYSIFYLNPAR